jgi:5-methylcytosine-specific restriction endonuclease McrA
MPEQHYSRLTELTIEQGMALIVSGVPFVHIDGFRLNLDSIRLKTFLRTGTACRTCGLQATHFAVERDRKNKAQQPYHMNLWAGSTLMTRDHMIAKSLGGKDHLLNCETMCSPCNSRKSKLEIRVLKLLEAAKLFENGILIVR